MNAVALVKILVQSLGLHPHFNQTNCVHTPIMASTIKFIP